MCLNLKAQICLHFEIFYYFFLSKAKHYVQFNKAFILRRKEIKLFIMN